jgi:hypothetical protein
MPAVSVNNQQSIGDQFRIGSQARMNGRERRRFRVAPVAIQPLQFRSQLGGARRIAR